MMRSLVLSLLLLPVLGCAHRSREAVEQVVSSPAVGQAVSLPASGKVANPRGGAGFTLRVVPDMADPTRVRVTVTAPDAAALAPFARLGAAPDRWEKVLMLAVASHDKGPSAPPIPMVGRYLLGSNSITFIPGPALTPGVRYYALFEPSAAGVSTAERYVTPYTPPTTPRQPVASVTVVYPTQSELPANLLKFYVYFARPMAEGEVFRHVRLQNNVGGEVVEAFREVELWSDDHRRLTLWVNPGRTKRSLGLSESLGPVLEPDRRYTLVIDAGLPDQRGVRMVSGYRKTFHTTPPDRVQPQMAQWTLRLPRAGSMGALDVTFPEPMDRALTLRTLHVEDASGHAIAGQGHLEDGGRVWSFVPNSAWRPNPHRLAAEAALEDLAGNSLERPFETREGEQTLPPPGAGKRFRAFTPTPAK